MKSKAVVSVALALALLAGYPAMTMAADYTVEEQVLTGTVIEFAGPENAIKNIVIHGVTMQGGEGEPSPTNPRAVYGVSNPVVSVNGQNYTIPTTQQVLSGGTVDSRGYEYHAKDIYSITGTEDWRCVYGIQLTPYYAGLPSVGTLKVPSEVVCSHFVYAPWNTYTQEINSISTNDFNHVINIKHNDIRLNPTGFKSWLAGESQAGRPVQVVYDLKAPKSIQKDALTITNAAGRVRIESEFEMTVTANVYADWDGEDDSSSESSEPDDSSSSDISSQPDDSSDGGDSSSSSSSSAGDDSFVVRHLMDTPLDDYSVTEGLLLLLVAFAAMIALTSLFWRR